MTTAPGTGIVKPFCHDFPANIKACLSSDLQALQTPMKQTLFNDKYPVFVVEIAKTETSYPTVSALVDYYKAKIAENPKVQFIGVFDHLAHTTRIGGEVMRGLQAAVDIVFCFGFALPNPLVLAVRPRSIGIADLGDKFVISFMEAPMAPANQAMEAWTLALRNTI